MRDNLPGPDLWVLFRRNVEGPADEPELKVYLSCAPTETPLDELVRVSGMRWPIEACFAEGNGELGLARLQQRLNAREGDLPVAERNLARRDIRESCRDIGPMGQCLYNQISIAAVDLQKP